MPPISTGLEQVGAAAAQSVGQREVGAAAGERKARNRVRREAVVGTGREAPDAAGRAGSSEDVIAVGGLRAAEAGRPHAPARVVDFAQRRLAIKRGIGVAFVLRTLLAVRG